MADNRKNFAYSTIVTAPSPSISGTSLVVSSGDGTLFPSVPFNVTIWPSGVQPLSNNGEIVRVTNIVSDTFTITRSQEGTSAISISSGYQIAATITKKSLDDLLPYNGATDDLNMGIYGVCFLNDVNSCLEPRIAGVSVIFGGANYAIGDELILVQTEGTTGTVIVAGESGGVINYVTLNGQGEKYSLGPTTTVAGTGVGSGATINIDSLKVNLDISGNATIGGLTTLNNVFFYNDVNIGITSNMGWKDGEVLDAAITVVAPGVISFITGDALSNYTVDFDMNNVTSYRTLTLPDKSGTIALLDDISGTWDKPYGDAVFTYDVEGNVDTKTVGLTVLTFNYDIDGNVDTITDGTNLKTFTYDLSGNLTDIVYT